MAGCAVVRRQALLKLDADSVRADILCRDMKGLLARLPGLETRRLTMVRHSPMK